MRSLSSTALLFMTLAALGAAGCSADAGDEPVKAADHAGNDAGNDAGDDAADQVVPEAPGSAPGTTDSVDHKVVAIASASASWFDDGGNPGLAFSITNTSTGPYRIQQIVLSFGNGAPVTFQTDALVAEWEASASATNRFRLSLFQNGSKAHLSSSLNQSGRVEIANGDAAFTHFASGELHVLTRGVLTDNKQVWEAKTTLSSP